MDRRNGTYGFDLWVPRGGSKSNSEQRGTEMSTGRYHALMVEGEEDSGVGSGFAGLDDLM